MVFLGLNIFFRFQPISIKKTYAKQISTAQVLDSKTLDTQINFKDSKSQEKETGPLGDNSSGDHYFGSFHESLGCCLHGLHFKNSLETHKALVY